MNWTNHLIAIDDPVITKGYDGQGHVRPQHERFGHLVLQLTLYGYWSWLVMVYRRMKKMESRSWIFSHGRHVSCKKPVDFRSQVLLKLGNARKLVFGDPAKVGGVLAAESEPRRGLTVLENHGHTILLVQPLDEHLAGFGVWVSRQSIVDAHGCVRLIRHFPQTGVATEQVLKYISAPSST